jgi:hypothetical protein
LLRGLVSLDSDFPGEYIPGKTQLTQATTTNGKATGGVDRSCVLNRVMFLSGQDLAALQKECAAESLSAGASLFSVSDVINALL